MPAKNNGGGETSKKAMLFWGLKHSFKFELAASALHCFF